VLTLSATSQQCLTLIQNELSGSGVFQPVARVMRVERPGSSADEDDAERPILCERKGSLQMVSTRQQQPVSLAFQHLEVYYNIYYNV
jgi:hypothetical protein